MIFQSPIDNALLQRFAGGDDVVFLERAVWSTLSGHILAAPLSRLLKSGCRLYVLQDELEINGIEMAQLLTGVETIDYPAWVDLTVENKVIKTWR